MSRLVHLSALPFALLVALLLQGAAPPAGPLPSEIARWVEDLGSDTFEERETASKKLAKAGRPAEAALEKAATSKDAEVSKRAKKILADFRWGIYPNTPPAVIKLIKSYQTATALEKRGLIRKLFATGAEGCRALAKIAQAETDPLVRQVVYQDIGAELARGAAVLLEKGDLPALESLLEIALVGHPATGGRDYAAFHLLRGTLDKKIAYYEVLAKRHSTGKPQAVILLYLYRAKGDLAKAVKAAQKAEEAVLEEGLLYEKAAWKELADNDKFLSAAPLSERLGMKAAYLRLSGQDKEFGETIAELKHETKLLIKDKARIYPEAKALLLNGQTTDAIDILDEGKGDAKLRFELRLGRLDVEKAMEMAAAARKDASADLAILEILEARTLVSVGEKDKGKKLFKQYADQIKRGNEFPWYGDLVKSEWDVGLEDDAYAHAAKIMDTSFDDGWPTRLLPHFYGDDSETAMILWGLMFKADRRQTNEARLKRLRALMEGKAYQKALEALAEKIDELKKVERKELIALFWVSLGEAAKDCKQAKFAEKYFTNAGTIRGGIALGDMAAGRKEWKEAAKRYLAAYQQGLKKPDDNTVRSDAAETSQVPLALYLHGWALDKAGQKAEGKKRMEQAHLLPLGNGAVRYDLTKAYRKRGLAAPMRREQFLLRRTGELQLREAGSYYTSEGLRGAAYDAMAKKDYLAAADLLEQTYLLGIQPAIRFTRDSAHLTVPANNLYMRARGLLAKGKTKEALAAIEQARQVLPGSVDMAINLVPELEKKGKKKEAATLFNGIIGAYDKVIKKYPKWAMMYNQAAWTCACCKMDLKKGLTYAKKAVELAPKQSAYHDTLAEVLFQSGKKDDAIAAQKAAIKLRPNYEYFKKQLKRIEKGDPKTPRPSGDGE